MKTTFTTEAKQILSDKLVKALNKENLTAKFACDAFEITGASRYVFISYARNPEKLHKCPESVWSLIQGWANSGKTIREYGVKNGKRDAFTDVRKEVSPIPAPDHHHQRNHNDLQIKGRMLRDKGAIDLTPETNLFNLSLELKKERESLLKKINAIDMLLEFYEK